MAVFRAFKALRPTEGKVAQVAALPYDVVNREEAAAIGKENPDSFLHVDRAEIDLPADTDLYDKRVYQMARENLLRMEKRGILVQDEKPCYYIYELVRRGKSQTGIVGCASIDDYLNGVVKKHEFTKPEQEQDRIDHMDVCDANTGPIYFACRYTEALAAFLEQWKNEHKAVCDFTEEDEITHRVWVIDQDNAIDLVRTEMEKIPAFYIADGHHRAASAVKVGLKRRQENPGYTGEEEFNYFLSVAFPYEQLTILAYNRVVKDLNGQSVEQILEKIKEKFDMTIVPGFPAKPVEKHCFGMYLDGFWYLLKAKPVIYEGKAVADQLDSQLLQENVLKPILGIDDPGTDRRISFVGGIHKLRELQSMADETGGIAFALYPASIEELMQLADENRLMPPKSTWFEPKLRSGIFIHKLS